VGTHCFGSDSGDEDSIEERADCSNSSGSRQLGRSALKGIVGQVPLEVVRVGGVCESEKKVLFDDDRS